jgi:hypothetical protein
MLGFLRAYLAWALNSMSQKYQCLFIAILCAKYFVYKPLPIHRSNSRREPPFPALLRTHPHTSGIAAPSVQFCGTVLRESVMLRLVKDEIEPYDFEEFGRLLQLVLLP